MKINQSTPILAAFAALLLFVAGCNAPAKNENAAEASAMTTAEKQAIETEIAGLTKAFFQKVEKLDIEACMTYFENTRLIFWP